MRNRQNKVGLSVASVAACLALAGVWAVLALSGTALAVKPDNSPGGGKKDSGGTLTAAFCVTFAGFPDRIQSDFVLSGSDTYCASKKDKIGAGTGSGPGFRFDTNESGKFGSRRMALLDFADLIEGHVVNEGVAFGFAEIDMRFIKDSPTEGGLDLGALAIPAPGEDPGLDSIGTVSLRIQFEGETLGGGFLVFGPDPESPFLGCAGSNEVTVTRWDEFTWTIESFPEDFACLNAVEGIDQFEIIGLFHMPFLITLIDMESL